MTAVLDFPTPPVLGAPASRSDVDEFLAYKRWQAVRAAGPMAGPFQVDGPSALVPRTTLRLPLPLCVVNTPESERCPDCAGTGISVFDVGVIGACGCAVAVYGR